LDAESGKLRRQHSHIPFKPVLAKVDVECESMIESMVVDQRETRAIDKAKVFAIVAHEDRVAVCSIASVTRSTLIPVRSNAFMNSTADLWLTLKRISVYVSLRTRLDVKNCAFDWSKLG
jgi:hypothetical protein